MATAVLSPQDCLSSPQNRQNRHFSSVPYRPASAPRSGVKASTARYVASAHASDCARRGSGGGANFGDGRGLLGRRNASSGLLPLPNQGLQTAHPYLHMPSSKASSGGGRSTAFCGGGGQSMASYSPPFRKFVSSAPLCSPTVGSAAALSRQSSSVPARRSASAGLPPQQSFARRRLLRERQNSTNGRLSLKAEQGNGAVGSWASVVGVAPVHTQPKSLSNLKFFDVKDTAQKKRVYGVDHGGYLRKRTHPELSHVEAHMDRQGMKLPFKVLPEGHGDITSHVKDQAGKKVGVARLLERSISDKLQDRIPVTILQRPRTKEAAEELIASFFQEVAGCAFPRSTNTGSHRLEEKCGALPSSRKEKLDVSSLPLEALDTDSHGKENDAIRWKTCYVSNSNAVRVGTPQVAATWKTDSMKKDSGAFCHTNLNYSTDNVAMSTSCLGVNGEHPSISKEDQPVDRLDFLANGTADKFPLRMGGTRQQIDMELLICKDDKGVAVMECGEISRCFDSELEDDRWLSMIESERWAGPSFFNSPSPSSLPLPRFMIKLSRASSLEPANIIDQHVQVNSEHSSVKASPISPEAKGSWDAAFATKDLRRILNLEPCSL